jgi:putative acetyltransferase
VSEWRIEVVTKATPELLDGARELFREYHEWLGEVVCSVRLAAEIASLPGPYSPPAGRLMLALDNDGSLAGVVGVRSVDSTMPQAGEIKRLYVRPPFRGCGLGRYLAEEALEAAADLGYSEVVLTTLPATMPQALALYRSLGFAAAQPFGDHSHLHEGAQMLYLRRPLRR